MTESEQRRHMAPEDYKLSMFVSPRARNPENNKGLREMRVHRLTDTQKAVGRVSIKQGKLNIFCEPCEKWTGRNLTEFPEEWSCPSCQRTYALELAIYEEVEPD